MVLIKGISSNSYNRRDLGIAYLEQLKHLKIHHLQSVELNWTGLLALKIKGNQSYKVKYETVSAYEVVQELSQ